MDSLRGKRQARTLIKYRTIPAEPAELLTVRPWRVADTDQMPHDPDVTGSLLVPHPDIGGHSSRSRKLDMVGWMQNHRIAPMQARSMKTGQRRDQ